MSLTLTENLLIRELENGKTPHWEHVFRLYYRHLVYFAEKFLKDEAAAEDVTVEAIINFTKTRPTFKTLPDLRAYLYKSVRNQCLNHKKQEERQLNAHTAIANHLPRYYEDEADREITKAQVLELIYKEIERLPPACREVFKLRYFEGKKSSDIAQLLKISEHTVRNHRKRALRLLRAEILKNNLSEGMLTAVIWYLTKLN